MNIGIYYPYDANTYFYAGANEHDLKVGDWLIFRTDKYPEAAGKVAFLDHKKMEEEIFFEGQILRKATAEDLDRLAKLAAKAKQAVGEANAKVKELGLTTNFVEGCFSFDEAELSLSFVTEERIDYREIVPKLAGFFKKRIHLIQLGPRDRAKAVGGYGICGRELCCTRVLPKFHSVTMEMARTQELIMKGADKLSGPCGKLLCCLAYELKEYQKLSKTMPVYGSQVQTPAGSGKVIGLNILDQIVKCYVEGAGVKSYPVAQIQFASGGGKKPKSDKAPA